MAIKSGPVLMDYKERLELKPGLPESVSKELERLHESLSTFAGRDEYSDRILGLITGIHKCYFSERYHYIEEMKERKDQEREARKRALMDSIHSTKEML